MCYRQLPSLYLAALLILGYMALATKRTWIRTSSLLLFAVVGMLAVILYFVLFLPSLYLLQVFLFLYLKGQSPTIALLSFAAEFIMFGYLASTTRRRSLRVLYWTIVAILVSGVIAGLMAIRHSLD